MTTMNAPSSQSQQERRREPEDDHERAEGEDSAARELIETGREARDNAVALVSSLRSAATLVRRAAEEQLRERPYTTLGIAAGAGFVVGGGLASSITRGLVSAGTKLAMLTVFDEIVDRLADRAESAESAESADGAGEPRSPRRR